VLASISTAVAEVTGRDATLADAVTAGVAEVVDGAVPGPPTMIPTADEILQLQPLPDQPR
jgi:hypothetical protein